MEIHGFNKLTLLDYPGKLAATLFTGACNFRCPFCHNASLVLNPSSQPLISEEDFFSWLISRKGKIEGVCVTGGEPTLQKDLLQFLKRIKDEGFCVKLDSNGYRPDVLEEAVENKLVDYIAMDIKNCQERYAETIGIEKGFFDISKIKESVSLLKENKVAYEFRTTIVKEFHDYSSIEKIAEWLEGDSSYYLQCYKDSGDIIEGGLSARSQKELEEFKNILVKKVPNTAIRG